jgi:hypothetical protein
MAEEPAKQESRWIGLIVAAGVALVLAAAGTRFYFGLLTSSKETVERFDHLGGAVGPFGTLATVGALFAALWSVRLQREDLRLQREELKLQRQEMADSRAELARTAKAQEDLAKAQRDATEVQRELALAQRRANAQAVRSEHAQRMATVANLDAAIADVNTRMAASPERFSVPVASAARMNAEAFMKGMAATEAQEWARIKKLSEKIEQHPEDDDGK